MERARRWAGSRGASLVEYLVLIGLIAVVVLGGARYFGQRSQSKTEAQAICVGSLKCGSGSVGADGKPISATSMPLDEGGELGLPRDSGHHDDGGKPWWKRGLDVGKGFVEEAWGTVTGIVHVVLHPIETVKALWSAVTHPVTTAVAIKDAVVAAWNENPEELIGRGIFEIVTLPLSVAKVSKLKFVGAARVVRTAEVAEDAAAVAKTADKLGDAAKLAKAAEAAAAVSPAVRTVLKEKLATLGLDASDAAVDKLLRLETGLSDSAVGKLRAEVLTNPKYAEDVRTALAHFSDEALRAGVETPDAKLLRLELLSMSVPEATRAAFMDAVRADIGASSARLGDFLAANPGTRFQRVIVGGGPQGQTIANELHRVGYGESTLVVDAAKGDQNFGSIRLFDLNSKNGLYDGINPGNVAGRSQNPLHGSPVQVSDLTDRAFPNAGTFGDASTIGLYGAMRRGTDVLADTKVTGVVDGAGKGWPARYRIELSDGAKEFSVYSDEVVVSTGLGKPMLPKDPGTKALAQAEMAKLAHSADDLAKVRVISGEDLLRASNHVTDQAAFYRASDGPIWYIGGGDAAKTAVEHFGEVTKGGVRPDAKWVGVKTEDFPERYFKAKDLVDSGAIVPTNPGGRLSKIEEIEGTNKLRLTFDTPQGPVTHEAGKVVLAVGMESDVPHVLEGVVHEFNPKTNLIDVKGIDSHYGDGTLAKQVIVDGKPQDIYVVGVASGLERPTGVSFLQYFGWKNVQFTDQVLARGAHEASPAGVLHGGGATTGVRAPGP